MNVIWSRVLRSVYRKEPITGFVITAGSVNVAIGGFDGSTSLVIFGLSVVGVALALRWWQLHRRTPQQAQQNAVYVLPPATSQQSLPTLTMPKTNPKKRSL
jgi:hypothetical protein